MILQLNIFNEYINIFRIDISSIALITNTSIIILIIIRP